MHSLSGSFDIFFFLNIYLTYIITLRIENSSKKIKHVIQGNFSICSIKAQVNTKYEFCESVLSNYCARETLHLPLLMSNHGINSI